MAVITNRYPHFYLGIQRDDEGRWRWVGENDEATFTLWTSIPDNGYNCVRGYIYEPTSWFQEPCRLSTYNAFVLPCEIGGKMPDLSFQNKTKIKREKEHSESITIVFY